MGWPETGGGERSRRRGFALGALAAPGLAWAHGPPAWRLWPSAIRAAPSILLLLVGSDLVVAARRQAVEVAGCRARLVMRLSAGLGGIGAGLVVALLGQGPWSTPFAVAAGFLAALLGLLAVVAHQGARRAR